MSSGGGGREEDEYQYESQLTTATDMSSYVPNQGSEPLCWLHSSIKVLLRLVSNILNYRYSNPEFDFGEQKPKKKRTWDVLFEVVSDLKFHDPDIETKLIKQLMYAEEKQQEAETAAAAGEAAAGEAAAGAAGAAGAAAGLDIHFKDSYKKLLLYVLFNCLIRLRFECVNSEGEFTKDVFEYFTEILNEPSLFLSRLNDSKYAFLLQNRKFTSEISDILSEFKEATSAIGGGGGVSAGEAELDEDELDEDELREALDEAETADAVVDSANIFFTEQKENDVWWRRWANLVWPVRLAPAEPAPIFQVVSYETLDSDSVNAVIDAIKNGLHVSIEVTLGQDAFAKAFLSHYENKRRPVAHLLEPVGPRHAMTIIDHCEYWNGESKEDVFTIQNSYGEGWGNNGTIKYTLEELTRLKTDCCWVTPIDPSILKKKHTAIKSKAGPFVSKTNIVFDSFDKLIYLCAHGRSIRLLEQNIQMRKMICQKNNTVFNIWAYKDESRRNPIQVALSLGKMDFVDYLLTLNENPLIMACIYGYLDIVTYLLDGGVDVNFRDSNGNYPIIMACIYGHVDIVRLLLDKGADINIQDEDGDSPIGVSCYNGHYPIVQLLLEGGVEINTKNNDGEGPLELARLGMEKAQTQEHKEIFSAIISLIPPESGGGGESKRPRHKGGGGDEGVKDRTKRLGVEKQETGKRSRKKLIHKQKRRTVRRNSHSKKRKQTRRLRPRK